MTMIRVVLTDDHPIVLDGLEQLFLREKDFEIVARCVNGEDAIRAVRHHKPDVLVLDIQMPRMNGLQVLREIHEQKIPTRVVLLTAALDEDQVMEAMRLGVAGLVLKEMASKRLVQCVRHVSGGDQWLESSLVSKALEKMMKREQGSREVARVLTPRETEVVKMVATGLRNKEIGEKLQISEGTVKIHLHAIYEKLQITGRVELTLFARDKGLL